MQRSVSLVPLLNRMTGEVSPNVNGDGVDVHALVVVFDVNYFSGAVLLYYIFITNGVTFYNDCVTVGLATAAIILHFVELDTSTPHCLHRARFLLLQPNLWAQKPF
jgi:hypothetical protein